MSTPTLREIALMIDHSLLHPTLTDAQLDAGCTLAAQHGTATVCVKPYHVPRAARQLAGTGVRVCSVIGFPHGNSHPRLKVLETEQALAEGAAEIDMVANAGHVLGDQEAAVVADLAPVQAACAARGAALKVIFENDYLQEAHIRTLCRICSDLGVAFVKTSTGYGFVRQPNGDYNYRGATDEHLRLMRACCAPSVQIKAAGGVRTLDDVLRVRALGVTRIGATATILATARERGFPPGGAATAAAAAAATAPTSTAL